MAGEEGLRGEATTAFELQGKDPESIAATTDHNAGFVRQQNFAGRARVFDDFGLPDFEQMGLWLNWQISECAGPRHEPADAIPERARRLGPIEMAVLLFDFRGVSNAVGGLRVG